MSGQESIYNMINKLPGAVERKESLHLVMDILHRVVDELNQHDTRLLNAGIRVVNLEAAQRSPAPSKSVVVECCGGLVDNVYNLPPGVDYQVLDWDVFESGADLEDVNNMLKRFDLEPIITAGEIGFARKRLAEFLNRQT